ncbi:hypothetical protein BKA67DRAFT_688448 [Truncatella angustata]|uniref:Major facilitator superfamily (MFS) profile domain-containing protein n=1 Tax=Truncatella angustata TaxID=152316 RepID=A0A9P8URM4_9PEZI|nr:uncharacterized protein BKA67DRAFT_688448 [Truncatella angustata]KAH6657088.1 hypothetical protein BKA67DRAFT_688448 [Truncatella angustata]
MMAAVFLMQSLGQLAAYAFGLAILVGFGNKLSDQNADNDQVERTIDIVWRLTIGIGAIPALVSLFLRRIIPETPLFLAAQGKVDDAAEAAAIVYAPDAAIQPIGQGEANQNHQGTNGLVRTLKSKKGTSPTSTIDHLKQIKEYLSEKGRWRALLGVMLTWWLLDLAYYGLGLDNPRTISTIWLSRDPLTDPEVDKSCMFIDSSNSTLNGTWLDESWHADPARPCVSIYEILKQDSIRNIITVSTGTVTGSVVLLFSINYIPRVTWMGWMFVALAALFAVNGGTFFVTFESDKHALTMTLYVLAQVIFNLGPNTMTFILPAELFGTKYRATFYGLAGASGKFGAIVIQAILSQPVFKGARLTESYEKSFAGLLLGFCPAMLLGAFVTWTWIPEVQLPRGLDQARDEDVDENASDDGLSGDPRTVTFRQQLKLPNRSLEDIDRNPDAGQILGMRRNVSRLLCALTRSKVISRPQASMAEVGGGGSRQAENLIGVEESDIGDGLQPRGRY